MNKVIKINPNDNLVVALENLKKGEIVSVEDQKITLFEDVLQKHKFALDVLKKGDSLFMCQPEHSQMSSPVH